MAFSNQNPDLVQNWAPAKLAPRENSLRRSRLDDDLNYSGAHSQTSELRNETSVQEPIPALNRNRSQQRPTLHYHTETFRSPAIPDTDPSTQDDSPHTGPSICDGGDLQKGLHETNPHPDKPGTGSTFDESSGKSRRQDHILQPLPARALPKVAAVIRSPSRALTASISVAAAPLLGSRPPSPITHSPPRYPSRPTTPFLPAANRLLSRPHRMPLPRRSNSADMAGTPSSTTYQQPQRPHASLMRSWRERLDEKEGRNPRRARSTLSLHSRLPSLTEDEVVNERGVSSHGENVDPVNPRSTSPATPHGFTGVMPRFYPLAAGLATLPPTPSTLVVLFPGDEKEQLRARIVLASQELADKEEELAKEKKQAAEAKASAAKEMEKLRRKLKEAEENNRQLRERVATMTKDGEKEKWWS